MVPLETTAFLKKLTPILLDLCLLKHRRFIVFLCSFQGAFVPFLGLFGCAVSGATLIIILRRAGSVNTFWKKNMTFLAIPTDGGCA
jgi:hypothetical protein